MICRPSLSPKPRAAGLVNGHRLSPRQGGCHPVPISSAPPPAVGIPQQIQRRDPQPLGSRGENRLGSQGSGHLPRQGIGPPHMSPAQANSPATGFVHHHHRRIPLLVLQEGGNEPHHRPCGQDEETALHLGPGLGNGFC